MKVNVWSTQRATCPFTDLGFVETVEESRPSKRTDPLSGLGLITASRDRNGSHVTKLQVLPFETRYLCPVVCVCACVGHLVMLGTICRSELQSASRPIFSMQPVMSRKKRKKPLAATFRFIHTRSLRWGADGTERARAVSSF